MTYTETVNWMFSKLPMYQSQGALAYKANLDNALLLCEHLGNPERRLKFVHVAGTNGKGSTSHMLASILQEAGYKTGLYTSPHIKDFRERIKINGADIPEIAVVQFAEHNQEFFEQNSLSFFEMTVGLAFDHFDKEHVDIAIIEVGLGGRLDATNVITPLLSVITNIGIDHTQFLGNTIELIAGEKAGIIKPGIPVIVGEYTQSTKAIFTDIATQNQSDIYFAADLITEDYPSALLGHYQVANRKTVLQAIRVLQQISAFSIDEDAIKRGFLYVIQNTWLRGRWQQLGENPTIICDTAHNKHGLEVVMKQVSEAHYSQLHIVLGVVNDKDLSEILPLFPTDAIYYFCRPKIYRGLEAEILQHEASKFGLDGKTYDSVSAAYVAAQQNAAESDFIYIGGSTFVVAEVL